MMAVQSKKRFIVLLADGARYDVFKALLEQGKLPHIEQAFLREGSFVKGSSVFPSTTGPAYMPFLTGCFPGTCNVPGIRWFDKKVFGERRFSLNRFRSYVGFESLLMNRDMSSKVGTLFEHFPRSYNIFSAVNRGVVSRNNLSSHMKLWYWYYAHLTDHWHLVDQAALQKSLKVIQSDFQFLFAVFPGIDEYSHLSHASHPEATKAYVTVDRAIGAFVKELHRQKKYEETALFIVSDHGLSQVQQHFGVATFLEQQGIKTFYYPRILKSGFEAASMVSGNGMVNLYFRGKGSWGSRMNYEEILKDYSHVFTGLLENPAVDLMACQDGEGWIRVVGRHGECRIREKNKKIEFVNLMGDLFQVSSLTSPMDYMECLAATIDGPYPDALVQLVQIFRSPRAGDLVLSAAKGFDLRKRFEYPEHKSSHGALHDEHMLIPFFSSVKLNRSFVRSVDLYPSILSLHGDDVPEGIDGSSFLVA